MAVVPAQEILDKIERGLPVEYDHVIVKGDLDLSKLNLPERPFSSDFFVNYWIFFPENTTIVASSIGLSDSIIQGNMYFANTVFGNSVNFKGSSFNGTADFGYSSFNGDVDFQGSSFNGNADFQGSSFNGDADFQGSSFNGNADFYGWYFDGIADFGIPSFNGVANFPDSSFNGDVDFQGSSFNGNAYFYSSSFNGTSVFVSSKFNNSDFSKAQFSKTTSFDDAMFSNSTSFNSSRFKEDALFEGAVFNGTLYLTRAKYDRLYISWKNINDLGYDDAAYLTLLENFKKLGYLEDYDGCYYEYRKAHRNQNWSGRYHSMMSPSEEWIRKHILDVGLDDFYGYGKKPILPMLWSGGIILLFGVVWRMAGLKRDNGENHRGILERYGPQDGKRPWAWRGELGSIADALIFSATLFLSGTRLFVDPPQMPEMRRWSPTQAKAASIVERVLGAFFSILFFLAISGTVVR